MRRRDFLRKGLAFGTAALLPGTGLPAFGGLLDVADSDDKKRILREARAIPGKTSDVKFSDFILFDAITPKIKATDKQGVIHEMVQSLLDAGGIKKEEYEGIVKAIIKREELGSTGIGCGIALPHEKYPSMKRHVGAFAISTEGIDFDCLDDEKAQLFFMVISPSDDSIGHLRVMEHLTRRLKDDTFRRFLKQSKTREEILALLEEDDSDERR